jgi:hypothetical protein
MISGRHRQRTQVRVETGILPMTSRFSVVQNDIAKYTADGIGK